MPTEVTRDAPAKPQLPIDESVKIPESVRRAAAKAESYYQKQAAAPPEPVQPPVPPAPVQDQPAPITPQAPVAAPVQDQPAPPVAPAPEPDSVGTADQEHHRYLSMKGRYEQSSQTIGVMQEQLQELSDELIRTQNVLRNQPLAPHAAPPAPQPPQKLITPEDVQNYGPDLLDVVQRAAREAMSGDLDDVRRENSQLKQQVSQARTQTVQQQLDSSLPEWRTLNRDPRFLRWLSLRDVYSGAVRHNMLNAAFQAADAPRVVAFFKGFLNEEQATGHVPAPAQGQPQDAPAPRQAAISLETLAAPGRPRPATGDTQVTPLDKPIFTRAQISRFYDDVRRGVYNGRPADKNALEQQLFAAQREGRVRG